RFVSSCPPVVHLYRVILRSLSCRRGSVGGMGFPLPAQFEFGQFGGSAMATSSWAGVHARPVKPVPGAWRRGDARRAGRGRPRSVIPSPLPRGPGPLPARGYELEGRRVQAVAQAGRRRAVGQHVTEVAVTPW